MVASDGLWSAKEQVVNKPHACLGKYVMIVTCTAEVPGEGVHNQVRAGGERFEQGVQQSIWIKDVH